MAIKSGYKITTALCVLGCAFPIRGGRLFTSGYPGFMHDVHIGFLDSPFAENLHITVRMFSLSSLLKMKFTLTINTVYVIGTMKALLQ